MPRSSTCCSTASGTPSPRADANGKWLRVASIFAAINQAGNRNPYPAPGDAAKDAARYSPVGP